MNKWSFKTAQLNSSDNMDFVALSPAQKARIKKYTEALEVAARSAVANPPFSNYFVKVGVGTVNGKMLPGGNIEYGICQALHGEESAVAAFRSHYGRKNVGETVLGIIAGSPGNITTPCGNCRDIMLEDLGTDFEIVSGAASGGIAIVAKMSQYLFSEFRSLDCKNADLKVEGKVEGIDSANVWDNIDKAIRRGALLVNDAYSPKNVHPERRYHALIETPKHTFIGARDVMCDYHPIYALRDAIRQARRANDPFVQSVVIVCEDFGGGAPQVMYKDRQHLLELNLQAELLVGKENDPPVFLATYDAQHQVIGIWETSVKEWIPFAFIPSNFGQEFIENLTNYFRGLGQ